MTQMQTGWKLVDSTGLTLNSWGAVYGQTAAVPGVIVCPNGDQVQAPQPNVDYGGVQLVPLMLDQPVPKIISDRQFFQQLAAQGLITNDEALAAVSNGSLPTTLAGLISNLPADQQFPAKMLLCGNVQFDRDHPLVSTLAQQFGWTSDQIDALWMAAALL